MQAHSALAWCICDGVTKHATHHLICLQGLQLIYLTYRHRYLYLVLVSLFGWTSVVVLWTSLYQRHKKVTALMNAFRLTPLVQQQWVRATASYRLVPGDVIVLQRGRAVCDMVLLQGACLVNESILSGEVRLLSRAWAEGCCLLRCMHIDLQHVLAECPRVSPELLSNA